MGNNNCLCSLLKGLLDFYFLIALKRVYKNLVKLYSSQFFEKSEEILPKI